VWRPFGKIEIIVVVKPKVHPKLHFFPIPAEENPLEEDIMGYG